MGNHQEDICRDSHQCLGLQTEKEQGMDNSWYLAEDRRKETAEGQDIEHKVTQTPRAGSRSLQDKGQRGEEERSE